MSGKQKKKNIYRKPLNLNIGMIIFSVVSIYVVICVITYFRTGHIVRYEVQEGSLATENIYRGVVIRDETVVNAVSAGYVNYFAREGERVAKDDLVYIVDETGRLNEELEDVSLGENTLSDKELAEFRSEIVNFMHGYDSGNYETTYDFKYTLKNTVLKLANSNMLQSINGKEGASGIANIVSYCNAPITGIVAYWTDGYESLTSEMVTADIFDEEKYIKNQYVGNELRAIGDPVYKLSTNENWSIVVPIDEERGIQMQEEDYVKVRFLKNQYESWGKATLLRNGDGNTYLELSFTNSMITFVSDRFLDIELIINEETGLKIPNSAIVEKEFYLIPKRFVKQSEEQSGYSIMKEVYPENGDPSTQSLEVDVYSYDEKEEMYYMDASLLDAGDVLRKQDGQETYTVTKKATLIGVYNMNKGYADFKQISILYQNDEYSIVKANTQYGLNVYDYIVLDATTVSDDQFINEIKKSE